MAVTPKVCSVNECAESAIAFGFCRTHYYRNRTYGNPFGVGNIRPSYQRLRNGLKICALCRAEKTADKFSKTGQNGVHAWCKDCRNARRRQGYAADPQHYIEATRRAQIKHLYGITAQEYVELLAQQGGCCAICDQPASNKFGLSVDHDHRCCPGKRSCGKCVRGLLCVSCNSLLGLAVDDTRRLKKAIAYLEEG